MACQHNHIAQTNILDIRLIVNVKREEMTVMFADVPNFTGLSANMSPQENFYFINTLFGRMGPLVRQHHGFINK